MKKVAGPFFLFVLFMGLSSPSLSYAVQSGKTLTWPGGGQGVVEFEEKEHAKKGYKCDSCHPKLFQMKKGGAKMTMSALKVASIAVPAIMEMSHLAPEILTNVTNVTKDIGRKRKDITMMITRIIMKNIMEMTTDKIGSEWTLLLLSREVFNNEKSWCGSSSIFFLLRTWPDL